MNTPNIVSLREPYVAVPVYANANARERFMGLALLTGYLAEVKFTLLEREQGLQVGSLVRCELMAISGPLLKSKKNLYGPDEPFLWTLHFPLYAWPAAVCAEHLTALVDALSNKGYAHLPNKLVNLAEPIYHPREAKGLKAPVVTVTVNRC